MWLPGLHPISQFDNSDYDALWDGGDIAMHKPNGHIPRDPVTLPTIANYRIGLLSPSEMV